MEYPLTETQKAHYRESLVRQGLSGEELERRYSRWLRAMEETRLFGPLAYLERDALRIRDALLSTSAAIGRPPLPQLEVQIESIVGRVFEGPEEVARKARDELKRMAKGLGIEY